MLRNPWLTVQFTQTHAAIVDTMMGNIANAVPKWLNLTPDDKSSCMKGGVAQIGMLLQIERICKKNPEIMPRYHDLDEFYKLVESVRVLLEIKSVLESALEGVENTLTGATDDGLRIAMDYYYSIKRAAKTSNKAGLRKQWMAIRNNFIHSSGQTPEEMLPEDDETPDSNTPTDENP